MHHTSIHSYVHPFCFTANRYNVPSFLQSMNDSIHSKGIRRQQLHNAWEPSSTMTGKSQSLCDALQAMACFPAFSTLAVRNLQNNSLLTSFRDLSSKAHGPLPTPNRLEILGHRNTLVPFQAPHHQCLATRLKQDPLEPDNVKVL